MLANVFQLSAGILLGISSFIVKTTFQIPVFGQKLPGSLERFKQVWVIRIGLIFLVIGYVLPIVEWDPHFSENYLARIIFSFVCVSLLIITGYIIASILAHRDYEKEPLVGDKGAGEPGMIALDYSDEKE